MYTKHCACCDKLTFFKKMAYIEGEGHVCLGCADFYAKEYGIECVLNDDGEGEDDY